MKKIVLTLIFVVCFACLAIYVPNVACARAELTSFRTWYDSTGHTGFEIVIRDKDQEVENQYITFTFCNSSGENLTSFTVRLREYESAKWRDGEADVYTFARNIRIKGFLDGKYNIASVKARF